MQSGLIDLLKFFGFAALATLITSPQASQAAIVVVSGGTTAEISSFLNANFSNVTEVRQGNFALFSGTAAQDALNGTGPYAGNGAADLVIIGRTLASADYDNFDSQGYNTLTIPVVSFTSYVSRSDANRLGWHSGGATGDKSTAGFETVITAAGNSLFGLGPYDWHNSAGGTFNGLGLGSVGGGDILATIGGDISVAAWDVGDAPGDTLAAGLATFPGKRLLFNLDNDDVGAGLNTFASLTPTGQAALVNALGTVGLVAIPEPSTICLAALGILGLFSYGRQRKRYRPRD